MFRSKFAAKRGGFSVQIVNDFHVIRNEPYRSNY